MKSDEEIERERAALEPLIGPTRAGWYAESCLVEYGDHSEAALWKLRDGNTRFSAEKSKFCYSARLITFVSGVTGNDSKQWRILQVAADRSDKG